MGPNPIRWASLLKNKIKTCGYRDRQAQKEDDFTTQGENGNTMKEEADIGVMLSEAKKCLGPPEARREAVTELILWVLCLFHAGMWLLLSLDWVNWRWHSGDFIIMPAWTVSLPAPWLSHPWPTDSFLLSPGWYPGVKTLSLGRVSITCISVLLPVWSDLWTLRPGHSKLPASEALCYLILFRGLCLSHPGKHCAICEWQLLEHKLRRWCSLVHWDGIPWSCATEA